MSCIVGELQNGRLLNVKINISNQIIDFVNENYKVEKWFLFKFDKIQLKRKQLHITFKNKIDFI